MSWRRIHWFAAAALVLGAAGAPAFGAGFGIFEQGSKSMGMAGAFTAQADDPSMLFYNAGGLGFVQKSGFALGVTWIHSTKADFQGAAPYPGPRREQEKALSAFPPHAYWVSAINDTWKWGIGIESPFGLVTEWKNPNTFSGRFISTKASLQVLDVNPTLGWQVTPNLGLGVGAIARFSKVELDRHIPFNNPFTFQVNDVGALKLQNDSYAKGYGFNVGLLHKVTPSFSWGLSYRSKITVDYTGSARVTQISTGDAGLDGLLRTQIPYDTKLPVKTSIDFPDMASLGLAFGLTPDMLVEVDANYTGWSKFQQVPITFTGGPTNSLPSAVIPERWKRAYNYRLGLRWGQDFGQWRFGYVYDQSPQPEASVNPLLPDANRNGFTIGFGHDSTGFTWDFALMYLKFAERTRKITVENDPVFHGTYNTTAWLLAATIGWK